MRLDYRDARPIYLQIVDTYRREISAGVLGQGERLPSVRELAAELSINPNTIGRAYRQLEMEGWIATVPGKGCYVQGIPPEQQDPAEGPLADFLQAGRKLLALGYTARELMDRLEQEERHA